jgi:hypothetical protein
VSTDVVERGQFAESENVFVLAGIFLSSPRVIRARDTGDLGVGEFTVGAVDRAAELATIYE